MFTAIGLSADCFAVTLSISISRPGMSFSSFARFPVAFGLFQALMMLIGWLLGNSIVEFISSFDHWLAFALLVFIGGRMIWESLHEKEEAGPKKDINRWLTVLVLAVATSIDSLAVGLSYAFIHVDIVLAVVITGIMAYLITVIGYFIGKRVGELVGQRAEIAGGIILILIGVKILLEHLL